MKEFYQEHKREIALVAAPIVLTTAVVVAVPSLAKSAAVLVFTGACLAVGFWSGKKVTNLIDEAYYTSDKKITEIAKDLGVIPG